MLAGVGQKVVLGVSFSLVSESHLSTRLTGSGMCVV